MQNYFQQETHWTLDKLHNFCVDCVGSAIVDEIKNLNGRPEKYKYGGGLWSPLHTFP
jgi:hypothetical protein